MKLLVLDDKSLVFFSLAMISVSDNLLSSAILQIIQLVKLSAKNV